MSRLIKSQFAFKDEEKKQTISVLPTEKLFLQKFNDAEQIDPEIAKQNNYLIETAKKEAEQIIASAQTEYQTILNNLEEERSNWHLEREQMLEQARQEGYAEGLELGRRDAITQFEDLISESQRIVELSKREFDEKIQAAESVILSLAINIAEKVIAQKIDDSADNFLSLVKQGLQEVKDYKNIKIFVHPALYEFVLSQKNELEQLLTNDTDLSFYANVELEEDACYIESSFGRIDVSVDTQLQQLKQQLLQILDEG
ncbi:flagellar assembly protein FliH [Metabacillus malikii]|uniref:Flagellar assembly protein FliH n=1 Tax=Metabacillus malikii TaxID=1504265 RepID=A0ABT9ZEV5_9BACI|nr:flagellar assembly protein FliH [Metabacillus malikii]MDQ0230535.1 flagellar assembly protein FliH [Metabacillus malikii]